MSQIALDTETLRPLIAAAVRELAVESRFDPRWVEGTPQIVRDLWDDECRAFKDHFGYDPRL